MASDELYIVQFILYSLTSLYCVKSGNLLASGLSVGCVTLNFVLFIGTLL